MKVGNPKRAALALKVQWSATGDAEVPYRASVNGETWIIRINDFPDEHLYTLVINGREAEHFDDWPDSWSMPESAPSGVRLRRA